LSRVEVDKLLWNPGDRGPLHRELVELRVPELGPVVFPAYAGTDVSVRAREVADVIRSNTELSHAVQSLMAGGTAVWTLPVDEVEPSEVARALLFDLPARTEVEPDDGDNRSEPDGDDGVTITDQQDPEAAPRSTHPAADDAPPSEAPVTYPSDQAERQHRARLAYVTRERVRKW
jgi:hypothetical protein